MDGDLTSVVATTFGLKNWASAGISPQYVQGGIQYVAVYNRNDVDVYIDWLGTFEVWVGTSEAPYTHLCQTVTAIGRSDAPYVVNCGGVVGEEVRVEQIGLPARYLTIAEVRVCTA